MAEGLAERIRLPRRLQRLHAALIDGERRLEERAPNPTSQMTVEVCRKLLMDARGATRRPLGRFWAPREFLAWDCLAQFDRRFVYLLSQPELGALWQSLKAEADEKLRGHRKQATAELIRQTGEAIPSHEVAAEVMRHIHVASMNSYFAMDQLRRQIDLAAVMLLALLLGLLVVSAFGGLSMFSPGTANSLLFGTLLGLLGGVLSLTFTITRTDVRTKIPAIRASYEVAAIRPLVGAALALPVILIFESGLIAKATADNNWVIALACFMAGFSERWFLGIVEGIEKKKSDVQ